MELVGFSLDGFDVAVEAQRVKDILRPRRLVDIQGMPPFIEGFVETNAVAVPVVDLRKRFCIPGKRNTRGAAAIVLMDRHVIGLLFDDFGDFMEVEAERHPSAEPLPFDAPLDAVSVAVHGGKKIFVLIPERLFGDEERYLLIGPIFRNTE